MENEHSEQAAELTAEVITEALRGVRYPGLTRDLVSFGMVQHVSVCDGRVKVRLALRAPDRQRAPDSTKSINASPPERSAPRRWPSRSWPRSPRQPQSRTAPPPTHGPSRLGLRASST